MNQAVDGGESVLGGEGDSDGIGGGDGYILIIGGSEVIIFPTVVL